MAIIVIDAGHGGFDNGAMYQGRKEKDDNLRLALAVGKILKQQGYEVIYTRTTDIYQSPYEKAQIANEAGADYFISFHRNSGENDNTYNGAQALIYGGDDMRARRLAEAINEELVKAGFADLGIEERTGLAVLRRTEMPAVLIEAGFINHDRDNEIFDNLKETIKELWNDSFILDITTAKNYREIQKQQKRKIDEISGKYGSKVSKPPLETSIMMMDWKLYVTKVKKDIYHKVDYRSSMLEIAHNLFEKKNFAQMEITERKAIAGLKSDFMGYEWGWFGSMQGAGKFKQNVNNNYQFLSDCLDKIPLSGIITYEQYMAAVNTYLNGDSENERKGLGTFTRLISMKRPDYFICVNKKNLATLCKDFGIIQAELTNKKYDIYENYWKQIIGRIQNSLWWNSPCPTDELEKQIWKGRAAMLDTIFYVE